MPQGENLSGSYVEMEGDIMPLQVITTTLGENNVGSYGPDDISEEKRTEIAQANTDPSYRRRASNRYICVDGRCTQTELDQADLDLEEYDPQMPGGKAVLETAIDFMLNPDPQPLSVTVPAKTRGVIESGRRVTTHGANGNKEGCKANQDMAQVLKENAANMDIVVPIAVSVNQGLGIDRFFRTDRLTEMVVTGNGASDNETLWDLDAAGVVNAVVASGGEYLDLVGDHSEKGIRVDLQEGAVRRAKLVKDLSAEDKAIQQFIASLGQYKKDIFEQYAANGQSETDAALHVAAAVLYTIGISKHLSSQKMPVHLAV